MFICGMLYCYICAYTTLIHYKILVCTHATFVHTEHLFYIQYWLDTYNISSIYDISLHTNSISETKGKNDNSAWCLFFFLLISICQKVLEYNCSYLKYCITLVPRGYDSFVVAIFSQKHRGIHITEFIFVSIKVIIALPRDFPNNDAMGFP